MKPIILFLSAICIALLGIVAAYLPDLKGQMILLGMMAFLVLSLVFGYAPKLRVGCAITGVVALFGVCVYGIYTEGLSWPSLFSGGGSALGVYIAHRSILKGRVAMKKSGLPVYPGDENKSDEELEAEEAAEKGWLIRHLKRFWNRGK